jgi:hypothetical protein
MSQCNRQVVRRLVICGHTMRGPALSMCMLLDTQIAIFPAAMDSQWLASSIYLRRQGHRP